MSPAKVDPQEHFGLVYYIAGKFRIAIGPRLDFDDLVQQGMLALLRCCKSFDPDQGVRFSTLVCTAIFRELRDYTARNVSSLTTRRNFFEKLQDGCQFAELATRESIPLETMDGTEIPLAANDDTPEVNAEYDLMLSRLASLSDRERETVVRHCMHGETFSSIGVDLQCDSKKISRACREGLAKLRGNTPCEQN